jgi:hypothetical protein
VTNQRKSWDRYPINEAKLEYPLAYCHYRRLQDANLTEAGEPVLSIGIESKVICWLPLARDVRRHYKMHWLIRGLRRMNELGSSRKVLYSISPLSVCTKKTKIDPVIVYKSVKKYLGNGAFPVEFFIDF